MALTYSQVIAYGRTVAGRAAAGRISDCYPDDPNLGLTPGQIDAAMTALAYPTRFPALAVNYYLALGQNLWPQCGGVHQDPNAGGTGQGTGPILPPAPVSSAPPAAGISSDTILLVGLGIGALLLFKWLSD